MYKPTWSEYQKGIQNAPNAESERAAAEAMLKEKRKEISLSKKAKEYEADSKKEWMKAKPEYVRKKDQEKMEQDPSYKLVKEIKSGGSHNFGLKPARGYILIELDTPEVQTSSGLYIAEEAAGEPNTATVVAVGDDLILDKNVVPTPVKEGAKVLIKKFAGMEITLKGQGLRMIQFNDVLGELI